MFAYSFYFIIPDQLAYYSLLLSMLTLNDIVDRIAHVWHTVDFHQINAKTINS